MFLLLGVDQLLDMGRTAVNVLGNCLATVVMAKWEGEFGTEAPSAAVKEAVYAVSRSACRRLTLPRRGKSRVRSSAVDVLRPHLQMLLAEVSDGALAPDLHKVVVQSRPDH